MTAPVENLVAVVFVALAAWRVAFLFVREDGPFDVVYRFRVLIRAWPSDPPGTGPLWQWEKLWSCMWCLSMWTGLVAVAAWYVEPLIVMVVAVWAIATLIDIFAPDG